MDMTTNPNTPTTADLVAGIRTLPRRTDPLAHGYTPATTADFAVGDTILAFGRGNYRHAVVEHITKTGTITAVYTTDGAVTDAQRIKDIAAQRKAAGRNTPESVEAEIEATHVQQAADLRKVMASDRPYRHVQEALAAEGIDLDTYIARKRTERGDHIRTQIETEAARWADHAERPLTDFVTVSRMKVKSTDKVFRLPA